MFVSKHLAVQIENICWMCGFFVFESVLLLSILTNDQLQFVSKCMHSLSSVEEKLQTQVTFKPNLNCSMFGAVSVEELLTDETKKNLINSIPWIMRLQIVKSQSAFQAVAMEFEQHGPL